MPEYEKEAGEKDRKEKGRKRRSRTRSRDGVGLRRGQLSHGGGSVLDV